MSQPKSKFKDPQTIIAIGVTVISLCALIVSLLQTRIMQEERELAREYSRISVWPRLELNLTKGHNPDGLTFNTLTVDLTNSGIGPAIITDVKVMYKGKIANNWWDLFELQEIPDSIPTTISNKGFNDRIIKIGETLEVLNLNENPPLAKAFYDRREDLSLMIYYESIYKEQWMYNWEQTVQLDDFKGLPEEDQFW